MFEDNNAVAFAAEGDVAIVGEDHKSNQLYRDLAREVIEEVRPQTAAIEASRPEAGRSCAMGEVQRFAERQEVPLLAVDTSWRVFAPDDVDHTGIYDIINDTGVNNEDGSYDPAYLGGARGGTIAKYGRATGDAVWSDREHVMAARLHWALDHGFPTPIVMACGCYHVKALKERLDDPDHDRIELTEDRINPRRKVTA